MSDPIANYFARYPAFNYIPTWDWRQKDAFNALAQELEWSQERRLREWQYFKETWAAAIEKEFAESTLERYQNLCEELRIAPIPDSIRECKRELSKIYVNIVDLMQYRKDKQTGRHAQPVILFNNASELREYTEREQKWCPVETAKAEMLGVLLKNLR